jgi:hypothetical protein
MVATAGIFAVLLAGSDIAYRRVEKPGRALIMRLSTLSRRQQTSTARFVDA